MSGEPNRNEATLALFPGVVQSESARWALGYVDGEHTGQQTRALAQTLIPDSIDDTLSIGT